MSFDEKNRRIVKQKHSEKNDIAILFIGIIMWRVGVYLSSHSLTAKNHPFLKESMIHHT